MKKKNSCYFYVFLFPLLDDFSKNKKKKNYVLISHLNYIKLGLIDIIYNINKISPILNKKKFIWTGHINTKIIDIPLYQFSQPDMRKE